ncbi:MULTISPECIES: hypothetical protein [Actinomycetes]|jgi:hypothetical protein|uniref:hypothetical protein n=1 Tax=Actinomycetes TaxID=1760 RepID=UPI0020411C9F|nr:MULTISPECIES: hypothetical protein [Actinomycetes]MCM3687592.1 hypothetical protein [Kocuria rosea]HST71248.1 hypothetical protein [Kocuria rosea]HWU08712.1 hypothetical protein [Streptomyces sp.]
MSNQSTPPVDSAGQPEGTGTEGLQHVVDQRLGQQRDGQDEGGTTQPRPEDQDDAPVTPGGANA